MRILIVSAVVFATASCAWLPPPAVETAPPPAGAPVALVPPPPAPVAPAPPSPVAAAAPMPFPFWAPAWFSGPPPAGRLTLSNFTYENAHVEAVITSAPDCAAPAGAPTSDFVLPINGTRIIQSVPGADICWRRAIAPAPASGSARATPGWTEWNRVFVSFGRSIDSQL